jgi:serine O-acetyltransferase
LIDVDEISGGEKVDAKLDEEIAAACSDVAARGRAGDLRLFGDPEQQELVEIARRLRAADPDATAVLPLNGPLRRRQIHELMEDLLDLLFPGLFHAHGPRCLSPNVTKDALAKIRRKLSTCIGAAVDIDSWPLLQSRQITKRIVSEFLHDLPRLRQALLDDARAAQEGDPAARSLHEVLLAYPGFIAVAAYRLAHRLHALDVPLVPRMMSEWAHMLTGIDIHPGARLGSSIFIDHGTGVVIGETAVIGDNVKLYHGVTLGAASTRHRHRTQRHPTIQDNVTLYAHATVLGGTTVIGENSVVGAAVLLTDSLPANSSVTAGRLNVVKTREARQRATVNLAANRV